MMEAKGDQESIDIAKKKVRAKQTNMREFINTSGRKRNRQREQIVPLDNKTKDYIRNHNNGLGNRNKNVRIPASTLKHSSIGEFAKPKNPKKKKRKYGKRWSWGGEHSVSKRAWNRV